MLERYSRVQLSAGAVLLLLPAIVSMARLNLTLRIGAANAAGLSVSAEVKGFEMYAM